MNIMSKGLAGVAALGLAASCGVVALAGCTQQEPVAVTINGEAITEKTITDYVQDFRSTNSLMDDKEWAQWLVDNGRDGESLRNDAIDYYVRTTVIDQDAKNRGITVTDADVTAQLDEIKSYYGYDDTQLAEQVEMIGYTMDSYREYIREQLVQEKLSAAVAEEQGEATSSDEDVLQLANSYSSVLNGSKEIKCIVLLPSDKEKAESIQKEASADGADFDKIAADNTTTTDYDGWNVLVTQDQDVANAIANMKKGEVSGVIEGMNNIFIVKVVDVCEVPEGGFTKLDEIPKALREEFVENVSLTAKATAFDSYVQDLVSNAKVERNPMPSGLPYDVSLDGIEPTKYEGDGQTVSVGEDGSVVLDENGNPVQVEASSDGSASADGSTNTTNTESGQSASSESADK